MSIAVRAAWCAAIRARVDGYLKASKPAITLEIVREYV